jgi:hypothetical protein
LNRKIRKVRKERTNGERREEKQEDQKIRRREVRRRGAIGGRGAAPSPLNPSDLPVSPLLRSPFVLSFHPNSFLIF